MQGYLGLIFPTVTVSFDMMETSYNNYEVEAMESVGCNTQQYA